MYEKFEKLLKEKGVTPYRVHKETGISTATLSDWKNGKSQPKRDKIEKICEYFEIPTSYFYGDDGTYFKSHGIKQITKIAYLRHFMGNCNCMKNNNLPLFAPSIL